MNGGTFIYVLSKTAVPFALIQELAPTISYPSHFKGAVELTVPIVAPLDLGLRLLLPTDCKLYFGTRITVCSRTIIPVTVAFTE